MEILIYFGAVIAIMINVALYEIEMENKDDENK